MSSDRARGLALFSTGRDWEASRILARACTSGPCDAVAMRKLGWARFAIGDAVGAEAAMRDAIAASPGEWEAHYGLGVILRSRDDGAAMLALSNAIERAHQDIDCLLALSSCALAQGDAEVAERFAERALTIDAGRHDVWIARGVALIAREQLEQANDALRHAENFESKAAAEQSPTQDPPRNLDRGLVLRLLGRVEDAIQYYEARLPDFPDATAHGQYGLALLAAGEFARGWRQYEFRWFDAWLAAQRAAYDRPAWRGEDLEGRTILLRCEQGVGDVLQFIRYAPLVKARGATVLLELRPGLDELAGMLPAIDGAYEHGQVTREFDCWCDLMSLPLALGTDAATIPAEVPYLTVDPVRRERWQARVTGAPNLRIGLVWAGDPRHLRDRQRSIPLKALRPLLGVRGVSWYSLQKGAAAAALTSSGSDGVVTNLADDLNDYADTAAAIEALDLVITVDTSVAHLAGALGKAVWVLLPTPADWRWLLGHESSPWYPTMRLFRQPTEGDWTEVVARVVEAVEVLRDRPRRAGVVTIEPITAFAHSVAHAPIPRVTHAQSDLSNLASACYTRVGWMQCVPSAGAAAVSLAHYGEYLRAEVDVLSSLVPSDSVIVEYGAGLGYHTIALAPRAGNDGQVLAIELRSVLRTALRQNVSSCGATGVSVMPGAIAGETIDALDFERLDLLKVSDPSHAESVIAGAAGTLWKLRPMVFTALGSRSVLDALSVRMIDFGYRCWAMDTALFDRSNFNRRDADAFEGARALALLAIPEERDLDLPAKVSGSMLEAIS